MMAESGNAGAREGGASGAGKVDAIEGVPGSLNHHRTVFNMHHQSLGKDPI
jgi:hypothetical protein